MKNPPRTTKIRGQKHLLAYITPDEAELLKAMGGSGEKVNGIPAFFDVGEGMGGYGTPGAADADGYDGEGPEAIREDQLAMAAELMSRPEAGLTREQYGAMPDYMRSVYDMTGAYNFDTDPSGKVTGFTGPSVINEALGFTPGIAGLLSSLTPDPTTEAELGGFYTGFGRMGSAAGPDVGGRSNTVPLATNPVTGERQCPDGYIFDEDLQACRLDTSMSAAPKLGSGKTFGRMGLLDIAPMGMSLFADRYGIPQQDFDAANLAFRRSGGLMKRQPGYTRLS